MMICQKSVENRQNTLMGAFLGSDKKFFFKMFYLININLFWDKSFALKSKITNFCMKSDILQQIASCEWHGFKNPRGNSWGFLKRPNNLVFYHQEGFRQLKNLFLGGFMKVTSRPTSLSENKKKISKMQKCYPNRPKIGLFWGVLIILVKKWSFTLFHAVAYFFILNPHCNTHIEFETHLKYFFPNF